MQPLTAADIVSHDEYEMMRPAVRRRMIVRKQKRRIIVGDHCSLHFENRDTLRYQVQEMLRAEESWMRRGAVDDELAAYNPLIPRTGQLSATLMLEYEAAGERSRMLSALVGIERHVWLVVGETPPVLAAFDQTQFDGRKVSSVQYLKFQLSTDQVQLLQRDGTVLRIVIDHPSYNAQAVVSEETRKEIARDPL
jgi:hypothetical protein